MWKVIIFCFFFVKFIVISIEFPLCNAGELFVLCEKSFNAEKIIILGTKYSLEQLSRAKCWLMDGTFEIAPLIMRQLFSIHGKVGTEIVPLIFCIMSSKSKDAYREFFYELCNISVNFKINLQPERIISDFEKASVLAAREFFPSANFKGCFFHFGKIIWRKIQSEGMATKYGNDEHFSKNMRMLKALAFVPESELELHFNELNSTLDDNEKKIAKWLQINYISGKKKRQPSYSPSFWTVSDSRKYPRTQNSVEAYHRRLQVISDKSHLGVYELIDNLGKEYIVVKTNIEKMNSGQRKANNRILIEKAARIKRILDTRNEMTILEFLKSISINLSSLC